MCVTDLIKGNVASQAQLSHKQRKRWINLRYLPSDYGFRVFLGFCFFYSLLDGELCEMAQNLKILDDLIHLSASDKINSSRFSFNAEIFNLLNDQNQTTDGG